MIAIGVIVKDTEFERVHTPVLMLSAWNRAGVLPAVLLTTNRYQVLMASVMAELGDLSKALMRAVNAPPPAIRMLTA
ncbi:hypothetical protein [Actinoplanes italicus]|uniref:hypothetical protein n=1 Tax=Actinoplanes italicus TaxID=113567 RepID=UPI001475C569|nr:hypothetical protein [Actinoplanes italicus]